jgi:hypothetical protein
MIRHGTARIGWMKRSEKNISGSTHAGERPNSGFESQIFLQAHALIHGHRGINPVPEISSVLLQI